MEILAYIIIHIKANTDRMSMFPYFSQEFSQINKFKMATLVYFVMKIGSLKVNISSNQLPITIWQFKLL